MNIIIAIIIFMILYLAQQKLYQRFWNRNLQIDVRFVEKYVQAGDVTWLIEVINNAKLLPLTVFHVKFSTSKTFQFDEQENAQITDAYYRNDAFSVLGNQKITRKLEFQTTKRGFYTIQALNIIARDFFLSKRFVKMLPNDSVLYVFPKKRNEQSLYALFQTMYGEIETRSSILEDPFVFRGIRDYCTTDSMRWINWKATARMDELMVNLYQHTAEQKVKILLNLETNTMLRTEDISEICISVASTASEYFLQKHIPVMIASNGRDIITKELGNVEYGSALDHQISIDQYLARIYENAGLDAFFKLIDQEIREVSQDVTYLIISSYRKEDLIMKLDDMVEQKSSVFMLSPYFDIEKSELDRAYIHGLEVKFGEA